MLAPDFAPAQLSLVDVVRAVRAGQAPPFAALYSW